MRDENIKRIINRELTLKSHCTLSDFTPNQLSKLQKAFSTFDYLSLTECCVWLGLSRRTIYSMIKRGKIYAFRPTQSKHGRYSIDVAKTKEILNIVK